MPRVNEPLPWLFVTASYIASLVWLALDYFSHSGGRERYSLSTVSTVMILAITIWVVVLVILLLTLVLRRKKGTRIVFPLLTQLIQPVVVLGLIALGVFLS